jgi:hypothetical protein
MARVFERIGNRHVPAKTVSKQGEAINLAFDAPFLQGIYEPSLGLPDGVFSFLCLDFECGSSTPAHA